MRYIYGISGREITKYTVIYGVYIRFWPTLDICTICAPSRPIVKIGGEGVCLHIRHPSIFINPESVAPIPCKWMSFASGCPCNPFDNKFPLMPFLHQCIAQLHVLALPAGVWVPPCRQQDYYTCTICECHLAISRTITHARLPACHLAVSRTKTHAQISARHLAVSRTSTHAPIIACHLSCQQDYYTCTICECHLVVSRTKTHARLSACHLAISRTNTHAQISACHLAVSRNYTHAQIIACHLSCQQDWNVQS